MRERQVDTGIVTLNFAEGPPDGPPFLFLHGGSGRWQYATAFVEALSAHWQVFAPDFRGHGKWRERAPLGAQNLPANVPRVVAAIAGFLADVRAP